jgi:hypothetical protein
LPQGPFSPLADPAAKVPGLSATARQSGINPWLWPIMAGGLTLAIVSAVLVLILSHLQTNRTGRPSQPSRTTADVESRIQTARKAIAGGDLKKAVEELDAARELIRQQPDLVPAIEARRLAALQREVALVNDWPREPLEQILARVGKLNPREWDVVVAGYRGKPAIFDLEVRRDPTGRYRVEGKRPAGEVTLRLELQNLAVLHPLPLADPQRLIFGARVTEIRREGAGTYAVLFEPDSGVLLTDPEVAAKCFLQPLDEPMREVIRRQADWLAAQ